MNEPMTSTQGRRGPNTERVVVLMYHRVGEAGNAWERKYCISPGVFAAHLRALADRGMRAVDMVDFVAWLQGRATLAPGSFVLSFDDGFFGVYEHAFPLLREMGWPATVFLVSGLIGGHDEWSRRENPSGATYPLLDAEQIEAMRSHGIRFHSHSRHHIRLTTLDDARLRDELEGSKRDLERLLGEPVSYLAYPYGAVNERVLAAARAAGYEAGFSVQPGFNRPGEGDAFRIRRLDVFGTDTPAMLARKVGLGTNDGSLRHAMGYYAARIGTRFGRRAP